MLEAVTVACPYCGEGFESTVDCSAGSQQYIEDCPVCCRPIEFRVAINANLEVEELRVERDDD